VESEGAVKVNVAIVHGIGVNSTGYADTLIKGMRGEFNRALRDVLKTSGDYSGELNFIPIIWDDILAYQEAVLADIYRKEYEKYKWSSLHALV
jgi:hypothetical protein